MSKIAITLALAACSPPHDAGGVPNPASGPLPSSPASTPTTTAPREWDIERGALRMHIVDQPGHLVDGNAPPPPPGQPLAPHPFLSGSCNADPVGCSEAGTLLRGSTSTDDFITRLATAGFTVKLRAR